MTSESERRTGIHRVKNVYENIHGVDASGCIPASVVAECRNALSALSALLQRDGQDAQDIVRLVYAVRDSESLIACQTVLSGWFDGPSPIMTMRLQSSFPLEGQRLMLSATLRPDGEEAGTDQTQH